MPFHREHNMKYSYTHLLTYGILQNSKQEVLSPMAYIEFHPSLILKDGVLVENAGFREHLLRRKKPSARPGVDVDVAPYDTEHLDYSEKPLVLAPATGKVVVCPGTIGTVAIIDSNNWYHVLLHNYIRGPSDFIKQGDIVQFGQPIAVLGNLKTDRDHVHYYVYYLDTNTNKSVYVDPYNTLRDIRDGAIVKVKDEVRQFEDSLLYEQIHHHKQDDRLDLRFYLLENNWRTP